MYGGGGIVEVGSVVVVGWFRGVRVGLVVLILECAVMVVMQHNGWVIVEDVMDVVVLVELEIGGLASNSSSIEKGVVVRMSSWEFVSGSVSRRSVSDYPPLSEIMSFSKRLFRVSLSIWLSMTYEM